jgi:ribosomal protein S18 acetylase RimI-like enzyme
MSLRVAIFAGEYAELAAWTGEPEEQLRAAQEAHAEVRDLWLAWDGTDLVGALHSWRAPDGRCRLYYDKCREDAFAPLAAMVEDGCHATIDASDETALAALAGAGFRESRRENEYEIPVTRVDAHVPTGIAIVTADNTELEPLMLLDCAIRADIPGSDGWQPDPVWFLAETYDSQFFDPQTYRVALDGDAYVGLARVWKALPGRDHRRLGCVGVLGPYRRRGLGRALIARAFTPLADAGETAVTAEADATNIASHSLLASFGARVTGGTVELSRSAQHQSG